MTRYYPNLTVREVKNKLAAAATLDMPATAYATGTWEDKDGELVFCGSGCQVVKLGRIWAHIRCDGDVIPVRPWGNQGKTEGTLSVGVGGKP